MECYFLADSSGVHFAGLYQSGDMVTYRDALSEMRLCFDLPGGQTTCSDGQDTDPWGCLALGFAGFVNLPAGAASNSPSVCFVTDRDLDQPLVVPPAATSIDPGEHPIVRFHLMRHQPCDLSSTAPLVSHLRAGCAQHIPRPTRRRDTRYLPPKKHSNDSRFARLPLRKVAMARRRSSQSPPKRSASGSVSPSKNSESNQLPTNEEDDFANLMAPPDMDIAADFARQTVAGFRSSCLVTARQCAVTGKGRSWCISPVVGPALQACHIVPQQHYHLYPDPEDFDGNDVELSPRRLQEAWQRTWAAGNGILLLSHLHELFDSRLFSIHPDTLQIRAFVPYDILLDYHGCIARVPSIVDRNALRHHYEMCVIENMAAKMPPLMDLVPKSDIRSGTASPFSAGANIPYIGPAVKDAENSHAGAQSGQNSSGDPSKRARPAKDGSSRSDDENQDGERPAKDSSSYSDEEEPGGAVYKHVRKRRRFSNKIEETAKSWPTYEGYITPSNSQYFLADVNWELGKLPVT
ncbi:hypothetical protein V8C42DRAFT_320433 [Trichoderma barbatum]